MLHRIISLLFSSQLPWSFHHAVSVFCAFRTSISDLPAMAMMVYNIGWLHNLYLLGASYEITTIGNGSTGVICVFIKNTSCIYRASNSFATPDEQ